MKTRLFVSSLPASISTEELTAMFRPFGNLIDVYIPNFSRKGGRAIGFVEFSNENEAANARERMHRKGYKGATLSIDYAKEKTESGQRTSQYGSSSNERRPMQRTSPRRARGGVFSDISKFVKQAEYREETPYVSKNSFVDFPFSSILKNNIAKKGYVTPTPIQDQALGIILEGRDVVGVANTGTGKTAAFLLPIIEKIIKDKNQKALIIIPTRELAVQIRDEMRSFSQDIHIRTVLCIGGTNMNSQREQLRTNPQVVIGTPGRLQDLINQRKLVLTSFQTIVLDEVDRMLDMGFVDAMKEIIALLPKNRQSLFFSATLPDSMKPIMNAFLHDPITVSVKQGTTSHFVDQDIVRVSDPTQKVDVLHDLLIKDGFDKVLIFGRTKHGVEKLAVTLQKRGFKAVSIHGDKTQAKRQKALRDFKENFVKILVATDVAARGLDIDNVTHVINYELPQTYEDYIHRIGRTGRANKKGFALTFVE